MKHPNTVAALLAYGATFAAQWLVARYAHIQLSDGWKQTVDGTVTGGVLYVGNAGVKAALQRVWLGPKAAWSGSPSPAPASSPSSAPE